VNCCCNCSIVQRLDYDYKRVSIATSFNVKKKHSGLQSGYVYGGSGHPEVLLSPIPVTSLITLESAEAYNSLTIYDQSGRKVLQRTIIQTRTLDIGEFRTGMYYIRLEGNDKTFVDKLIKH